MKILAINVLYYPLIGGGAEFILKDLSEGLSDRRYDVNVLTLNEKNRSEESINDVKVYREPVPNIYLPYFKEKKRPHFIKRRIWHIIDTYNPIGKKIVTNYVDKIKPDVIICHNIFGFSPSIWEISKERSIPTIQVLHDLYLLCPRNMFKNNQACKKQCLICKIMRIPHKKLSQNVTAVVGVSNFILNMYLSYGYFKDAAYKEVIYNSRRNIHSLFIQRKEIDDTVIFGFIGNIAPNKGIEVLLKAYMKVKNKRMKLLIAGSGEISYTNMLKQKYKDDSIVWLGWMKQDEFFSKVDFTIVPSIGYESLGMVAIESLYSGIPIIGSRIGGIPEIIKDGENGILFEPGNVNELAEKLKEGANNIKYWKEKSNEIKKSAEKFMDYKGWIERWEDLLKKVQIRKNF